MTQTYTPIANVTSAGQTDLGALFHSGAQARPQQVAITDGPRQLTYQQLDLRSNQLANAFLASGLESQQRVAILAGNCAEYFEVELGAAKAGLIVAALNWRLARRELQHCIDLVSPKLLIVSAALAESLAELDLGDMQTIVLGQQYEAFLGAGAQSYPDKRIDPENGLVILYTSGTTGLPKGALISHRAMIARGLSFVSELNMAHNDHFIAWAPMFHMVSTDQGLAILLRGGTVHMVDGYQADKMIALLERYPMRWLVMVPGMVTEFVEALRQHHTTLQPLGMIGAMADLIPREHIALATVALNAPFLNTFGATETGLVPATGSLIPIGEIPTSLSKRQSAFCDVRLVDPDDNEVAVGEPGEVAISGPTLFSGYWDNDKVNVSDFRGGRFHMGDVLRRNPDGTLDYVDRVKYMIKSGGENIYPAEIEQVIEADERVETAVVVRKEDERWGEVPVLLVVANTDTVTAKELMELCERDLSRYKRPREIHFISDEDLPRSTTGKIQRHILEQRIG